MELFVNWCPNQEKVGLRGLIYDFCADLNVIEYSKSPVIFRRWCHLSYQKMAFQKLLLESDFFDARSDWSFKNCVVANL